MSKYLYCPKCRSGYIEIWQDIIDDPRCIMCWTKREVYDNKKSFDRESKLKRILKQK